MGKRKLHTVPVVSTGAGGHRLGAKNCCDPPWSACADPAGSPTGSPRTLVALGDHGEFQGGPLLSYMVAPDTIPCFAERAHSRRRTVSYG